MEKYPNQSPVDREINVNPSIVLSCKINAGGFIEYVNHSFSEVSGYEEYEIIGESMDVLRHPDVPQVIYDVLKERLSKNEPIKLITKQLAKDGRFFWLLSEYESKLNEAGELVAHYSHSVAAPIFAVHKISSLYKILSKIESKSKNTEVSKRYLIGFLEERNLNYNQFIDELCAHQPKFEQEVQQQITNPVPKSNRTIPTLEQQNGPLLNSMSYNANLDLKNQNKFDNPNFTTIPRNKPKKKKSLLKKVFGK